MSRVLVVDDDIAEISAVKRVLTRAGHEPVLATNSADAMAVIHQQRPALLVLSATCEGGEALTLARALGENAATADLPLLVLGDADPLPRGARRLGRPLDPELLTAELNAAVAPQDGVAISLEDEDGARPPPAAAASTPAPARAAPAKPGARPPAPKPAARAPAPKPGAPPRPGAAARPAPDNAADKAPDRAPTAPPHGAVAIGRLQPPRASGLSDAAASRRAAAEALRARAEELRRSSGGTVQAAAPAPAPAAEPAAATGPAPAPAPTPAARPASARAPSARPAPAKAPADGPAAPSSVPRPSPVLIAPIAADAPGSSLSESLDLGDFESTLRQAESAIEQGGGDARSAADEARQRAADEALQALEEEATRAAEAARSRRAAGARGDGTGAGETPPWSEPPGEGGAREGRAAEEERALQEAIETARREAFEAAKRDASEAARREALEEARRELQEQARKEAAEAARLIQAEARARQEALANAEREARELAQREADARERAAQAEREVQALRSQLDEERRKGEERVATVMQRAAEEEEAAEESHRVHAAEEQKLRDAIVSARSEMEALRKKHEEEARRREEAEYALRRLEGTGRDRVPAPAEAGLEAAEAAPEFSPPSFFEPFDGAEAAAPAPAEEAARRRVAALRAGEPEAEERAAIAIEAAAPSSASADGPLSPEEPARPLPQPPPQLRGGDLAELPAPRLLAQAHRARLEGRLDFRGDTARSLWFEEGRVVGASSADPAERVEEVALRLGLITRDQHRQIAQSAAALPSRRAAMLLLERGFLKATELTALVRRRTEEVVFGVFADAEARFRWMGVEVPPEERTALERGTLALAVEGVRRRWLAPRVDALLGGPATLLAPVPGGPGPAELGLSPEERRVVALADGLRALDEILQGSPLDALSTRQLLAALVLTGALSIRSLQAGRPAGHALAAIDLARVREKLEQVRRADYFTVLGVGRLCTPHEVRDAARRLENEFDPRRYPTQGDEGLPARLAEILQVVHDAREVLADERLREEYLRGLGEAG